VRECSQSNKGHYLHYAWKQNLTTTCKSVNNAIKACKASRYGMEMWIKNYFFVSDHAWRVFLLRTLAAPKQNLTHTHTKFCTGKCQITTMAVIIAVIGQFLKVICNAFLPNWLKVFSSCLLQYKPVCVTNFDKLCRKMLKVQVYWSFWYSV